MVLVFGGTTEGRAAVEVLDAAGQPFYYSTRGAGQQVESIHGVRLSGGMEAGEMLAFCREHGIRLLVDAAHPFAVQLHRNIAFVSEQAGIPVVRYERIYPPRDPRLVWCDSYASAVEWLEGHGVRNLLALSGVQTIPALRAWWSGHPSWFRVLDRSESVELAQKYGFPRERLVLFHEDEPEEALLDALQPDAVLTKESGTSGYFEAKAQAALRRGIPLLVIKRPVLPESFYVVTGGHGLRHRVERLLPGFFPLSSGFTTGSCACAAAKGALWTLLTGEVRDKTTITLPCGEMVELPLVATWREGDAVTCSVRKDAGDDPDVTNGREIRATVELVDAPGVDFRGGEGVGIVTLPGLGLEVGEPAINPVPRRMIRAEVEELLQAAGVSRGVRVTVSVPGGEELAAKTFNPKLGIAGGISIIGTSGVVRPFSSEAFIATIRKEIQVAKALGCRHLVINSGAKSEKVLRRRFPDLLPQAFVHYGNYIGDTLQIADAEGIGQVSMGIMIGKAVKLAEGNADTHSRNVVMNRELIAGLLRESGCAESICEQVQHFSLARELWELLPEGHPFFPLLVQKCTEVCRTFFPQGGLELILVREGE